jgi:transcriptional regulator with XRE-family HTH domain
MSASAGRHNALGQFLRARREQVRPEEVGVPDFGRRRVPGLRREELALLAGISIDYYIRLEQGRDQHPSEHVLGALARALQLDDAANAHLHRLARPAPHRRRSPRRAERVPPGVLQLLESWPLTPAFVLGRYTDVLGANRLAGALHPAFAPGRNLLRDVFLDPASHETFVEWNKIATDAVASLRTSAGADLDDPRLAELIGELSLKSGDFRRLWARHHVRDKTDGIKMFRNPLVGELKLGYESFSVHSTAGQTLVVHHAEPGSTDEQALSLLAGITADDAKTGDHAHTRKGRLDGEISTGSA